MGWGGVNYTDVIRAIQVDSGITPEAVSVAVAKSMMTDETDGFENQPEPARTHTRHKHEP